MSKAKKNKPTYAKPVSGKVCGLCGEQYERFKLGDSREGSLSPYPLHEQVDHPNQADCILFLRRQLEKLRDNLFDACNDAIDSSMKW